MENNIIKFSRLADVNVSVKPEQFDAKILSIDVDGDDYTITFESEITKIGPKAVYTSKPLVSLELPDSVVSITGRSFNLKSFDKVKSKLLTPNGFFIKEDTLLAAIVPDDTEKVEIPEGIKTIGPWAFPKEIHSKKCQVVFPKSLIRVEEHAFEETTCKIKFNKNLEYIGDFAFVYPEDTNINVPDKVEHIGERAFNITERVKKIKLGKGLKTIGRGAFASELQSVTACEGPFATEDGNFLIFDGTLLRVATKDLIKRGFKSLTIPEGVHTIDTGAIPEPPVMPEFPKTLKTIRYGAVTYLNRMELTLPAYVTEIENGAFKYCSFDKFNSKLASKDGLYLKCNSVLILGSKKLEEAVIPKGTEEIGDFCFQSSNLSSVKFNKELKKIGVEAFRNCQNLKGKVVIPEGVEVIDNLAFDSTGITELELPSTLKFLGRDAVGPWNSPLKRLRINSPQFISLTFSVPQDLIIEVPEALLEQYKTSYTRIADKFIGF